LGTKICAKLSLALVPQALHPVPAQTEACGYRFSPVIIAI
jgi:hypothetical protein